MNRVNSIPDSLRRVLSSSDMLTILPFSARKLSHPGCEGRNYPYLILVGLIALLVLLCLVYTFGGNRVFSGKSSQLIIEEINYGIVLDAGSSGTRAYLYYWPEHSGNKHDLLSLHPMLEDGEPMVKKVTPGLSSLAHTPDTAFEYIRPLLLFARDNIPAEKHKETPLYILATAGMRLIDKQQQDAILENLRKGINENFQFLFTEGHLEIITGKQEGIYQWLSINYVLGRFSKSQNSGDRAELINVEKGPGARDSMVLRPRTVGALDMGGASMQIALEITTNLQLEEMQEKDKNQIVEINLGCTDHDVEHTYRVFVSTYLGFGANQAKERHERTLFLDAVLKDVTEGRTEKKRIKDPCRPLGMMDNITLSLDLDNYNLTAELKSRLEEHQNIYFYGTGDWESCYAALENFTKMGEQFLSCSQNCPDNGISIPPIQFDNSEFYGFSEFWYSMDDVLGMGGQYMYFKYRAASKDFCSTRWKTLYARFRQGVYPNADSERLESQCFKSAWVSVALHQGLTFPRHYGHLTAAPNTVQGEVVHWTLGALLYRTRFLPLRSIESVDGIHHYNSKQDHGIIHTPYIVWFCALTVSLGIIWYLCRLQRYVKPSSLRKVPSRIYFSSSSSFPDLSPDQEILIKREQDFLYTHTKVFVG